MRHTIKIPLLFTVLASLAAHCLAAKVPVYLQPQEGSRPFKEVELGELLLPHDASDPAKAAEGWKQAKLAIEQTGFTQAANVMKELTLKPGSKVHVDALEDSSLIGVYTGEQSVQILEPGAWTKVSLRKPITVYFTKETYAAAAEAAPALDPIPLLPPAQQAAPVPRKPMVAEVKTQEDSIGEHPEPLKTVVRTQLSAAAAPTDRISEFDALEQVDPAEVRRTIGPMSDTILDQIRELDPLEVRESAPSQLDIQKLNLELKPTVSISRDFTGKLIYKKATKTLAGTIKPQGFSPYQLVDADGKRLAYVRVEEIKVGNVLNYVNQQVILSGPLEENIGGETPVVQGRILRLDPAFLGQPAPQAPAQEK
jgi:hypothetical protein